MTEPRKPADRKPKAVPPADEHPAGWELLRPFSEVPVWDQTDLLEIVKPLTADVEEGKDDQGLDLMTFDTRIVGELARKLADMAVDRDAYLRFVSGAGALERAVNLGVAYANQLGESAPSTDG